MTPKPAENTGIVETRWFHVRHAPVPDGGRIYGQADLDCDCSDASIFRAVAQALPKDAVWLTSGLKRAQQTAAAIIAASDGKHAPALMPAHAALNEQHLGEWQGAERVAFKTARGMTPLSFWMTRGDERAPGGESYPDLARRVETTIAALTTQYSGRNIVSVTHGGTIRAALRFALDVPHDTSHAFMTDNCAITLVEHLRDTAKIGSGVWRVVTVNHRPWTGL